MNEDDVVREIVKNNAWSETAARLCLRAKFKCEYCDLSFLESPTAYKQIQFDHILPRRAGGADSEDNLAAVCRTCNIDWKSRWIPEVPPGTGRPELVEACRQYVRERRGARGLIAEELDRILGILKTARRTTADVTA